MSSRIRREGGFSLVEAVVALLILSMTLLGVSRMAIEQSRRVTLSRVDSQLWQLADSVLEQRSAETLVPAGESCAAGEARCELTLDPLRYSESWPVDLERPGCGLKLVLEAAPGLAMDVAPFVRETVSVEWVSRGRRRSVHLGRIRS